MLITYNSRLAAFMHVHLIWLCLVPDVSIAFLLSRLHHAYVCLLGTCCAVQVLQY